MTTVACTPFPTAVKQDISDGVEGADAGTLRFGDFSSTVDRYIGQLHKQVDEARKAAAAQHELLDAGAYKLAADPERSVAPPERLSSVPMIDFAPLLIYLQRS